MSKEQITKKPRIRFKNYSRNDFSDWETDTLEKLLKYEQPSRYIVHTTDYEDTYKVPVLTAGKTFILGYTNELDGVFSENKLPVIIFDDFTTASKLVSFPFKVKSSAIKILLNRDARKFDIHFVFYLMSTIRFSLGVEHKRYWISEYSKISIQVPSLQEQQKIADFLVSVDNWIDDLKSQKESLEKYKKGMMQKLFSREIRFKDANGNDFPDWEKTKIKDTGEISTGTTPSTANKGFYGGSIVWVTPTDINDTKYIATSERKLTDLGLKNGRAVPKGSLLVTCIASIGKNAILLVDGSCNQQINAIKPNKNYNVDFLYYLIKHHINRLLKYAGGGMLIVNKKDFSNIIFEIPSLQDQQKIADFLSSIDSQIELKQKQIQQTEQWKKGLMQEMFV